MYYATVHTGDRITIVRSMFKIQDLSSFENNINYCILFLIHILIGLIAVNTNRTNGNIRLLYYNSENRSKFKLENESKLIDKDIAELKNFKFCINTIL